MCWLTAGVQRGTGDNSLRTLHLDATWGLGTGGTHWLLKHSPQTGSVAGACLFRSFLKTAANHRRQEESHCETVQAFCSSKVFKAQGNFLLFKKYI